jgi:hypothetical protein
MHDANNPLILMGDHIRVPNRLETDNYYGCSGEFSWVKENATVPQSVTFDG